MGLQTHTPLRLLIENKMTSTQKLLKILELSNDAYNFTFIKQFLNQVDSEDTVMTRQFKKELDNIMRVIEKVVGRQ